MTEPDGLLAWILALQADLHRKLIEAVQAVRRGDAAGAGFGLIGLSFVYGVLHAVGPGHGKAVITTYALSGGDRIRRILGISALSSLAQAVTAVALVYGVLFVAERTSRQIGGAALGLELFANGLVAAVGLYMLVRAWRLWKASAPRHGDVHDHVHDEHCGCGHEELVQIAEPGETDRKAALGIILSIGARPCGGAILILVLAYSLDLHLAGIGAAFAMAVGTGLVVAAVALAAWSGRALGERGGRKRGWNLKRGAALATGVGGLVLVALGGLLMSAPQAGISVVP
jgi:ABC-type nickel/cobalt efflux system permease component RcnA